MCLPLCHRYPHFSHSHFQWAQERVALRERKRERERERGRERERVCRPCGKPSASRSDITHLCIFLLQPDLNTAFSVTTVDSRSGAPNGWDRRSQVKAP